MTHILLDEINWLHILIVTVVGFLIGGLWYSPLLFVKPWMKENGLTPEVCKERGKQGMAPRMIASFVLTFVSTTVLAVLVVDHHLFHFREGARLGAFVGIGLVAARQATNMMFEMKSFRHFLIVAGQDVVLLTVQGVLLSHWH